MQASFPAVISHFDWIWLVVHPHSPHATHQTPAMRFLLSSVILVGLVQELVKEGLIKGIGLSEISAADIRKAHAVHPITAIEMEWSLFSRDAEVFLDVSICIYAHIGCRVGYACKKKKNPSSKGKYATKKILNNEVKQHCAAPILNLTTTTTVACVICLLQPSSCLIARQHATTHEVADAAVCIIVTADCTSPAHVVL